MEGVEARESGAEEEDPEHEPEEIDENADLPARFKRNFRHLYTHKYVHFYTWHSKVFLQNMCWPKTQVFKSIRSTLNKRAKKGEG